MGCGKSKVMALTYKAGMDVETFFKLRVWSQNKPMFYSLNSASRWRCEGSHSPALSMFFLFLTTVTEQDALGAFAVYAQVDEE